MKTIKKIYWTIRGFTSYWSNLRATIGTLEYSNDLLFDMVKNLHKQIDMVKELSDNNKQDIGLINHSIDNIAQKIGQEYKNTSDSIDSHYEQIHTLRKELVKTNEEVYKVECLNASLTKEYLNDKAVQEYKEDKKNAIDEHNDNIIKLSETFAKWLWNSDIIDNRNDDDVYNKDRIIDNFAIVLEDAIEGTPKREVN